MAADISPVISASVEFAYSATPRPAPMGSIYYDGDAQKRRYYHCNTFL